MTKLVLYITNSAYVFVKMKLSLTFKHLVIKINIYMLVYVSNVSCKSLKLLPALFCGYMFCVKTTPLS